MTEKAKPKTVQVKAVRDFPMSADGGRSTKEIKAGTVVDVEPALAGALVALKLASYARDDDDR